MPKPAEGTKRAKAGKASKLTRLATLKKDGITPQMPPNPLPHVVTRLVEIGLSESTGMGTAPLSWREIDAWVARTGVELPPWEARLIRALSAAYVGETQRAESESCPPPWHAEVTQRERDVEAARLEMVLG